MVSREDQINAELASRVEATRQSVAIKFKNMTDDDRLAVLTDDEAIIITGRVYDKLDAVKDKAEWIVIGLIVLGVLLSIADGGIGPLIICAISAFASYYFMWTKRKETMALEILAALQSEGSSKMTCLGLGAQEVQQTTEAIAPVPPKEETAVKPLTDNPASVFDKPRQR